MGAGGSAGGDEALQLLPPAKSWPMLQVTQAVSVSKHKTRNKLQILQLAGNAAFGSSMVVLKILAASFPELLDVGLHCEGGDELSACNLPPQQQQQQQDGALLSPVQPGVYWRHRSPKKKAAAADAPHEPPAFDVTSILPHLQVCRRHAVVSLAAEPFCRR